MHACTHSYIISWICATIHEYMCTYIPNTCIKTCKQIYIHTTNIHTYTHTHTHTHRHAHIHTYTYTYVHTYTICTSSVRSHTSIHVYIDTYIHTWIYTFIHTNTHAYIHSYIHTYIYSEATRASTEPGYRFPWNVTVLFKVHINFLSFVSASQLLFCSLC